MFQKDKERKLPRKKILHYFLLPLVFSLLCWTGCSGGGSDSDEASLSSQEETSSPERENLSQVVYWAYQIQNLEEAGAVERLAASHYDLLVIEPTRTDWSSDNRNFDTKNAVQRLKASMGHNGQTRKLVLAYVDIGEAEDWRWYWKWSKEWGRGEARPDDWPEYILTHDPDGWEGNYPVAYWRSEWKDIMIYGRGQNSAPYGDYVSAVDEVIRDGFDGIYLDWVEGYENEEVVRAAQEDGVDPALEMVSFIREIRDYARSRSPNFLIIQQNAAALAELRPELLSVVDGVAQEAIWFDGSSGDRWNDPAGYDEENEASLTQYYIDALSLYQRAGLPVFDCEYALERAPEVYQRSLAREYIPYSTRRSLSELTSTPPPGY